MIVVSKFLFRKILKHYTGITLWPFIIVRDTPKEVGGRRFAMLINHERIHVRQQIETLIVFFYILYGIFYIINRCKGQNHMQAYANIPFERESYLHERDITYLRGRRIWAWLSYL